MGGSKKVFVKTFGCQMNVYDSARMIESLVPSGYAETSDMTDADLVVLNTCHIREKAAEKVYSELGRVRRISETRRRSGRATAIAVAGCVAQAEGEEILRRAPIVDIVVGPQAYHKLPELVRDAARDGRKRINVDFADDDKFAQLPQRTGPRISTAFLTVQEGCDKFCTFCVVPYTRGVEYSRPVNELVDEAHSLVQRGAREITLLGQNVNAYHGLGPDGRAWSLAELIERLSALEGLERLRYTTSHPRDMTDDLIQAHHKNNRLMPYLHLPFQSGSDRILEAMNRKHTAAEYRRLIDKIRSARPDIALSTDVIVGFPGESDEDFGATMALVREVGFAQAFSFKYSARPGTPATTLSGAVNEEEKSHRLQELQSVLDDQQLSFNAHCVGRTLPVLFDKKGRAHGQLIGRSPYLQAVHVIADQRLIGEIVPVEISAASKNSLTGAVSTA
ncbi:MAG: tRNA (N6-isopentenyl adenosine(37)-C2)-methylthiotransferase MiaB [Hyphomicrobiaceae bacterium]